MSLDNLISSAISAEERKAIEDAMVQIHNWRSLHPICCSYPPVTIFRVPGCTSKLLLTTSEIPPGISYHPLCTSGIVTTPRQPRPTISGIVPTISGILACISGIVATIPEILMQDWEYSHDHFTHSRIYSLTMSYHILTGRKYLTK